MIRSKGCYEEERAARNQLEGHFVPQPNSTFGDFSNTSYYEKILYIYIHILHNFSTFAFTALGKGKKIDRLG